MKTTDLFRHADDAISVNADQTVFQEGETGDTMYVVVEGRINLLVKGILVEELGPGGMFGEMALVDAAPRSATAIAKTNCKLVPINEKRFNFLVQQTPNFALQMIKTIADRLRRMDNRLTGNK